MFAELEDDVVVARPIAHQTYSSDENTPVSRHGTRCADCMQQTLCMPPDLERKDAARVDAITESTRLVRRGETLYRSSNVFESIYAVRVGSFKTVVVHRDGLEHVTGFYLAGDMLGLDGVSTDRHACDAIALEDSTVCVIPFHLLSKVCRDIEPMQHHVHRMLSAEIVRKASLLMQFGTMSAAQRVAAFLVDLSQRFKARGYSASEFNLRMTREEIGSYLGMKLETVSRMFSRLQDDGLVDSSGKQITIRDMEGLLRL
jgi:CRP/FNR family transcriptional regulator